MKYILSFVYSFVIVYIIFAFFSGELNLVEWSFEMKAPFFILVVVIGLAFCFNYAENGKQESSENQ